MYDQTNSTNPYLMNVKSRTPITGPEGIPLTAEYIWSKSGQDRVDLVQWVFDYYRRNGLSVFGLTDAELDNEMARLKEKDPFSVLYPAGLSSGSNLGLDAAKYFSEEPFLKARGEKGISCYDVFWDDKLFMKVLQNRMGWNTSKEDGTERPYVFAIDDKMIWQGMRSSGIASSISLFKPTIARYVYNKYRAKSTIDFSAGWAARAVGAISLGVEYWGLDPLTYKEVNRALKHYNSPGQVFGAASEKFDYSIMPDVDIAFSCPPYYKLEIYDPDSERQSVNAWSSYDMWLKGYWKNTVKRIWPKCKYFAFVAIQKACGENLLEDMKAICNTMGGEIVEENPLLVSKSHLSGKAKTKKSQKSTEHLVVWKTR